MNHFPSMWKTKLYGLVTFGMLMPVSRAYAQIRFPNPIKATSFPELIDSLTTAVIQIAIPFAIVVIMIAGFRFLLASSRGDQAGIGKARQLFWWTLIGTAIVVGASALAKAVIQFAQTL